MKAKAINYPNDTVKADIKASALQIKAQLIDKMREIAPTPFYNVKLWSILADVKWNLASFEVEEIDEAGVEEIALYKKAFELLAAGNAKEAEEIIKLNPGMEDAFDDYIIQGEVILKFHCVYSTPRKSSIYDELYSKHLSA